MTDATNPRKANTDHTTDTTKLPELADELRGIAGMIESCTPDLIDDTLWHTDTETACDALLRIAETLDAQAGRTEAAGDEVRVVFGLTAQGHMPTCAKMLADGKTWAEIGRAIGWCGETAERFYARENAALAQPTAPPPAPLGGPLLCPHGKPQPMHGPYAMPCHCAQPEPTGADAVEGIRTTIAKIIAGEADRDTVDAGWYLKDAEAVLAALRAIGWGPK